MATVLPPNPHLDHLKKQAKDLLKSFQAGDSQICASVQQHLPRFSRLSPNGFTLHDAQHVIARQYGFDNWSALRQAIKEMAATRHPASAMAAGGRLLIKSLLLHGPTARRGSRPRCPSQTPAP